MNLVLACNNPYRVTKSIARALSILKENSHVVKIVSDPTSFHKELLTKPDFVLVYGSGDGDSLDYVCNATLDAKIPVLFIFTGQDPTASFAGGKLFFTIDVAEFDIKPIFILETVAAFI